MNRKQSLIKIKEAAQNNGFTFLDVMPFFKGYAPSEVQDYIKKAYELGFITIDAKNPQCMYPTGKLLKLN